MTKSKLLDALCFAYMLGAACMLATIVVVTFKGPVWTGFAAWLALLVASYYFLRRVVTRAVQ